MSKAQVLCHGFKRDEEKRNYLRQSLQALQPKRMHAPVDLEKLRTY
jgi:hypothetical protein